MTNQQKQGFSVRDILIQIMFIILFVFIMIWLFPTKSNVSEQSNKIDALASNIFNNNILTMKDAAVSYYTIDRLPKSLNDKERMTLKEMLDKKLLVEFVDGNGNKCDIESSYVEVIKLEDEYQIKVSLTCTDNDAYIIVHLGCYDYCSAIGLCEKEEELVVTPNVAKTCKYEYEKVTGGKWGNYGNWSEWSTNAVSQTDYRLVETKVEKVKTGTTTVQTGSRLETEDATLTCPNGYDRNGSSCTKTTTDTVSATCPTGYSLSYGTCYGNGSETTTAEPECPTGYTFNGTTQCIKTTTDTDVVSATCEYGYALKNGKCIMVTPVEYNKGNYIETLEGPELPTTNETYYYESVSSDYTWACFEDCGMQWVITYKKYYTVVTGGETLTATPECPTGYTRSGSKCTKTTTTTDTVEATCAKGTLKDGLCHITVGKVVTATPKCPTGYTRSGSKCTKTTTDTVSANASCDTGYDINGTTCSRYVPVYGKEDVYSNVTYYRYKERSYISGTRVTAWSTSESDANLKQQSYSLTGKKECA